MIIQEQAQPQQKSKPYNQRAHTPRKVQRPRKRRSSDPQSMRSVAEPASAPQASDSAGLEAFAKLGLGPQSLAAVQRIRFNTPTDIQQKFIPAVLTGRDCVGLARTGTGKTTAFLLPICEYFSQGKPLRTLVLAPTRELAVQINEENRKLLGQAPPRSTAVYGGTPIKRQIDELRRKPEIVVATPGRLLDHVQRKTIDLAEFSLLVLDEVDRMFDMGFRKDITNILRRCTRRRQTLFLSATLPWETMRLAEQFLHDPIHVSAIDERGPSVETLDQRYFAVMEQRKLLLLIKILQRDKPELSLIFTRTKRGAERLGKELQRRGYKAMYIHGDLTQSRRQKALDNFRAHNIQLLVATDVMGRGIDVKGISHVINYNVPENPKDYLHRVGRSGRMNAPGKAFTFVTPSQGAEITAIETLCNHLLERDIIPGFDDGIPSRRVVRAASSR